MKTVPLILVSISLVVTGQMFLKVGMDQISKTGKVGINTASLIKVASSPTIIMALTLYAISALLWMVVLSRVELSFAYPFLGLTYVAMLFLTKYIFQERIPPTRWVGTIMIFLGVLLSAKK